jgi:hypothetical protein
LLGVRVAAGGALSGATVKWARGVAAFLMGVADVALTVAFAVALLVVLLGVINALGGGR